MTQATFLKVLWTLFTIFGGDWQSRIGELVQNVGSPPAESASAPDAAIGPDSEPVPLTPSDEPSRLNNFWSGYYGAVKSFYGDLDKLDWVAFYKNHGYRIDGGDSVRFMPTFPPIEWSFAAPDKSALPPPPTAPFAMPPNPPTSWSPPVWPIQAPWSNQRAGFPTVWPSVQGSFIPNPFPCCPYRQPQPAVLSQYYPAHNGPLVAPPAPAWTVNLKLMEADATGSAKELNNWPDVWVNQFGGFAADNAVSFPHRAGTIADLMSPDDPIELKSPCPRWDVPKRQVGTTVHGSVEKLGENRIKLLLDLKISEIDNAGKDNLLIVGKTFELTQRLQLGQRRKIMLQTDPAGEAKLWLEATVTERAAEPPSKAPSMSGPLPISMPDLTKRPGTIQVKFTRPEGMSLEGKSRSDQGHGRIDPDQFLRTNR